MKYEIGQSLQWTPVYWRWDTPRKVTVSKVYGDGHALLSNGVIVDQDGLSIAYSASRMVGRVNAC